MRDFMQVLFHILVVLALTVSGMPAQVPAHPLTSELLSSTWNMEPVSYFGGSSPPRLALDSGGVPHVFYCPPGSELYATRTQLGWTSEPVVTTAFGGGCGDLSMGADDLPRVTTGVAPIGYSCELYGVRVNATWSFECFPGGVLGAVDSHGRPQVVTYWTITSTRFDLRHLWREGNGTWQFETIEANALSASPSEVWYSTVLDPEDNPHVLYYDSVRGEVRYAFRDASGWHVEVVDPIGPLNLFSGTGSLVLDAAGVPRAVYTARTGPHDAEIRYAARNATWNIEIVSEPSSPYFSLGLSPTIGITRTGPVVLYRFESQ